MGGGARCPPSRALTSCNAGMRRGEALASARGHRAHPTRVPAPCGEPAPGCRCSAALAVSLPGFAGVRVCQLLCQPLCESCWWRIVQNFHGLCVLFVACCLRFLMPRLTVSDAVSASAQEEVMLPCSGEGDLPKCHSICLPGVLALRSETSML